MGARTFTGIELEYAYLRTGISNIGKLNCNTELLGIYYVETCIEGLFFRFGLLAIEAKNFQDTTTAKEKKRKENVPSRKAKAKAICITSAWHRDIASLCQYGLYY
jgi:hypothetical protein